MMQDKRKQTKIDRRKLKQFTPLWRELLKVCDNDKDQALIIATLEYFIDTKVKRFMKANNIDDIDFVDDRQFIVPMSRANLKGHDIKDHTFYVAVARLAELGFIEVFIERSKPNGPYYYTLNYEAIEDAITAAMDRQESENDDWAPPELRNYATKDFVRVDDIADRFARKKRKHVDSRTVSFCTKTANGRTSVASDFNVQEVRNQHAPENQGSDFNTTKHGKKQNSEKCGIENKTSIVDISIPICSACNTDVYTNQYPYCSDFNTTVSTVSCAEADQLHGAQGDINDEDTVAQLASFFTYLAGPEKAEKALGRIVYNRLIDIGKNNTDSRMENNPDRYNKSNPPSHYHSQPKAAPSAENDSAHHPQPSASDDESVAVQRTKPEKTTEGENDNTIPIYSPTSYLLSSSLNESTETEDLNTQTDIEGKTSESPSRPVPAENPENLPSPPLPVAAETLGNELSKDSKEEEQGGGRESIGFCIEGIVGAAPEPEPQKEVDARPADETSWLGAKVSAYPGAQPMRDTLGYYSGDPDVEDSEIRKQKGKGRRPDEPVKRRRRAFRSTKAVFGSADDWMAVIEERFMMGEYPKSVDHETVALAEYWIRALYRAEPRTAPSLDGMDGWPKVFAGLLTKYKKTPAQFRAISDYIRSTAGSAQWDWSRYVLSPEMLTRRTRNNNMLYIDYFLDIIERESKAVAVVGSSARSVSQQQQPQTTFRYEGMALYEKKEDLSRRMRAAHPKGYSLYLSICRAHSGVESFQGLKELFPEDMRHFVEEYMEITGWKPEVPSDNKD